jgi:L-asparaginase
MSKPKILIIYTGGTIGMIKDPETGNLSNVDFNLITQHVPEIKRLNLELSSVSIQQPIDSAQITPEHWREIGDLLFANYNNYDGFVILHGTDTMAYTASALSFMFKGLQKPVILTGSQLPIGVIRTDGKENLITALEIAGNPDSPKEVAVYFDYMLLRGNRSNKDSAEHFEAFRSPNYPPLATAGVHIEFHKSFYLVDDQPLTYFDKLEEAIVLIKLYPGINWSFIKTLVSSNVQGIILESFGSGNGLLNDEVFIAFDQFIKSGGVILNTTQCNSGAVNHDLYKAGEQFKALGVIEGGDLTTEAAVTKMMHVLANYPQNEWGKLLAEPIAGEMDA